MGTHNFLCKYCKAYIGEIGADVLRMGGGYFDQTVTPRCGRCSRANRWSKTNPLSASTKSLSVDVLSDPHQIAAKIQLSLSETERELRQNRSEELPPRRDALQDAAEAEADDLIFNRLAQSMVDEAKKRVS